MVTDLWKIKKDIRKVILCTMQRNKRWLHEKSTRLELELINTSVRAQCATAQLTHIVLHCLFIPFI